MKLNIDYITLNAIKKNVFDTFNRLNPNGYTRFVECLKNFSIDEFKEGGYKEVFQSVANMVSHTTIPEAGSFLYFFSVFATLKGMDATNIKLMCEYVLSNKFLGTYLNHAFTHLGHLIWNLPIDDHLSRYDFFNIFSSIFYRHYFDIYYDDLYLDLSSSSDLQYILNLWKDFFNTIIIANNVHIDNKDFYYDGFDSLPNSISKLTIESLGRTNILYYMISSTNSSIETIDLSLCKGLKEINIGAFVNFTNLKTLILPVSVNGSLTFVFNDPHLGIPLNHLDINYTIVKSKGYDILCQENDFLEQIKNNIKIV